MYFMFTMSQLKLIYTRQCVQGAYNNKTIVYIGVYWGFKME